MDEGFGSRLKIALAGESIHAFAQRSGISDSSLRSIVKRGAMPAADTALQIAELTGVSVQWLVTGEGSQAAAPPVGEALGSAHTDLSFIERLDVEASAGAGSLVENEQYLDFIAIQTRYLRHKGINPTAVRLLNIRGDSMEPTIRDGDIALVDTSISDIIDNAIYVLAVGNRLLIKRIHILMSGALRLISDNPLYPHEDVPANEADFVRVSGRVVWFGRSI